MRTGTTDTQTATARKLMGAWAIHRFDDFRRDHALLSLERLPLPPKVEPHDVLIRKHGAEVGDWDARVAAGEWPVDRSFPIILGLAGAGSIVDVGKSVVDLQKGDLVYTYNHPLSHRGCPSAHHNGAWAQDMLVPFDRVALAPTSLDLTHAGAVPIIGSTAHETIDDILQVFRHDIVLITAAAGGVGHLAVQIAARRGARVVALARRHNHEFLRGLGAAMTIDYTEADFVEVVRRAFPTGVDKALNGVAGETANGVVRVMKPVGHVVDLTGSATEKLPDGRVDTDYAVRPDRRRLAELARMFDGGDLQLEVSRVAPFADAPSALAEVLGKQVRGVVVLGIR
jgi:NADPH:quinone reductase-like Zn-dependent oxidoreductase